MLIWNMVDIGSGNGFLPADTKPLPDLKFTCHQWVEEISREMPNVYVLDMIWKLLILSQAHFSGKMWVE